MKPIDDMLTATDLYLNRELSLLKFHERVLKQAERSDMPLGERLRFLAISSTNLDEFFEVRVSSAKQQIQLGVSAAGADGRSPRETLTAVSEAAHRLVAEQYRVLNERLLPELQAAGIRILRRSEWSTAQRDWIGDFFLREVFPVLTPTAQDPAHPFPNIVNKCLNFIVQVEGEDSFGRPGGVAVVQAPRALPRLIRVGAITNTGVGAGSGAGVGAEDAGGLDDFVLLSSVIHANMSTLFPGMEITGCHQFRVTRKSDLWVDEEEVDDLLFAIAGELAGRKYAEPVRLEVDDTCPSGLADFLLRQFGLGREDLYQVNGPVNLHRISALCTEIDAPKLFFSGHVPEQHWPVTADANLFEVVRERDVLLHHPFESFRPVLELLRQAAEDPDVLAIKMTLYRTGEDSPVAQALLDAARAGKEVTVVVELRARFDEAANIDWATRFKAAGANVVYGIVGYKTHAKMLLVVRRGAHGLMRFVHLGTGNYHSKTARLYTDWGLMSADETLSAEVSALFHQLTGFGRMAEPKLLLPAPFVLDKRLKAAIARETAAAKAGKRGRIVAKMNSLSEPEMIRALYRASQAGVEIDLIIRGICCLRPGIPGVSETIRVRSIVGRFLEHSRIYYFYADGAENVFISSADWMRRNLFRRVESCTPILDAKHKQRLIHEGLGLYLEDGVDSWELAADGTYSRLDSGGPSAQKILMKLHKERVSLGEI